MNILFISDFNLSHNAGGAQVSNDLIIKRGVELGHNITLHNYDSSPLNLIHRYDLVISSNLEAINQTSKYIFDFILNHHNHVRLEHDSCSYLDNELRKRIFTSSKINFFLSEFHVSFFEKSYGNYFNNIEIVYDPLDIKLFYNNNSEKIYDIVYCGFLHELKGINNLIKFAQDNPNRKIDIFGWSEDENIFKKINLINNISINSKKTIFEIADIYRKSKYIYHSPIVNEPFCRMVGEALLCGCDFIGDENKVGSLQEFKKYGLEYFSKQCSSAVDTFWQKINNL